MAQKLSETGAITSTSSDDLVYVANTSDGGSTYVSKRITVENLFADISNSTDLGTFSGSVIGDNASVKDALQALETALETESSDRATAITTAVNNLIDAAPGTLDTLNEIAAALNDDPSFATTITNLINANETHIDNMATLTGVAKDSTTLGTFTGSTVADNQTVKQALQAIETQLEATQADVDGNESDADTAIAAVQADVDQNEADADAAIAANEVHIDNLATLSGLAKDTTDLGSFTGGTITSATTVKTALQELETAVETKCNTGANVNTLVGSTTDQGEPTNFLFLVVDQSDGSIKVMEKNFLEHEG